MIKVNEEPDKIILDNSLIPIKSDPSEYNIPDEDYNDDDD